MAFYTDLFGWGGGYASRQQAPNQLNQYATGQALHNSTNIGTYTTATGINATIGVYDSDITQKLTVSDEFARAVADKMDDIQKRAAQAIATKPPRRSIAPKPLSVKSLDFVTEMRIDAQEWLKPVLSEMRR